MHEKNISSGFNSVQAWRVHQHEDVFLMSCALGTSATVLLSGLGWANNVLLHLHIRHATPVHGLAHARHVSLVDGVLHLHIQIVLH